MTRRGARPCVPHFHERKKAQAVMLEAFARSHEPDAPTDEAQGFRGDRRLWYHENTGIFRLW
jgi:hypothetical protein